MKKSRRRKAEEERERGKIKQGREGEGSERGECDKNEGRGIEKQLTR